jgi:hypothetical protein
MKGDKLTDKQRLNREKRIANLKPFQYKKGQTGNALGRYLGGISGKERLKRMIMGMNDEEFEEWCNGINKIDLFKMAEGNPDNKIAGDTEHPIMVQIIKYGEQNNTTPVPPPAETLPDTSVGGV